MANSSGVAPICNAPPQQPTFTTKPPIIPRFVPPSVNSPQSMVSAIMALQLALQALTNPPPPNNTINGFPVGSGGGGPNNNAGGGGGSNPTNGPQEENQWREKSRETQNVKVVNPDDDSQFVIVKEITSITFERTATDESFTIKRDP